MAPWVPPLDPALLPQSVSVAVDLVAALETHGAVSAALYAMRARAAAVGGEAAAAANAAVATAAADVGCEPEAMAGEEEEVEENEEEVDEDMDDEGGLVDADGSGGSGGAGGSDGDGGDGGGKSSCTDSNRGWRISSFRNFSQFSESRIQSPQ